LRALKLKPKQTHNLSQEVENVVSKKYVYFFGGGEADGDASMKALLGGKGANLAEMTRLKLPVPPGFTISTDMCHYYLKNNHTYPDDLRPRVDEVLARMEKIMGRRFGDPSSPMLVSVRSGAPVSMPGMMDTVLNLGLNDVIVEGLAKQTNARFAYDAYRRFLKMYGDVVLGVKAEQHEGSILLRRRSIDSNMHAASSKTPRCPPRISSSFAWSFVRLSAQERGRMSPKIRVRSFAKQQGRSLVRGTTRVRCLIAN
jgi:phosphoenolpyruvate synthase/pyruvate phosphate dikinase